MGLSASMWTSVSGLLAHGEKMNVIGNNIANVNTLGFKAQRMDFQDFIYQNGYSTSGTTQIGRGVKIGAVLGDFSQAAFESTNDPTDLAIAGRGFFQVKDRNSDQVWYTRAGDFRFDKEGTLRDPNGLALQGWKIPNSSVTRETSGGTVVNSGTSTTVRGTGSPVDVKLDSWSVEPKATTKVKVSLNLTSKAGNDKTQDVNDPAFGLFKSWDGTKVPPISEDAYAYPASITVYDEGGTKHVLTMYCDQVTSTRTDSSGNTTTLGLPAGYTMYEYILTQDPTTDLRTFGGTYNTTTGQYEVNGGVPYSPTASKKYSAGDPLTPPADADCVDGVTAYVAPLAYVVRNNGDGTTTWAYDYDDAAVKAAVTAGTIPKASLSSVSGFLPTPSGAGVNGATYDPTAMPPLAIVQYPSGSWAYDASDPNVRAALNAVPPRIAANQVNKLDDGTGTFPLDNPDFSPPSKNSSLDWEVQPQVQSFANNKAAGILMTGTLIFNSAGQLVDTTAYTYMANNNYPEDPSNLIPQPNQDPSLLSSWYPTRLSTNGLPMFAANFTGAGGASTVGSSGASSKSIELDLGMQSVSGQSYPNYWKNTGSAATVGGYRDPDSAVNVYSELGTMTDPLRNSDATTSYADASQTGTRTQDGYSYGNLTNYSVDTGGILYGIYSNGVSLPLYQIAICDFVNKEGLRREGGNLFAATIASGEPQIGPAGEGGLGTVEAYSVEQSNVDMAKEFVQMITTQRGFQANSKLITTVDTMLETVIGMKR